MTVEETWTGLFEYDEASRLDVLAALNILYTRADPEFDTLTDLLRQQLQCDFAGLAFVDPHLCFYKSVQGKKVHELFTIRRKESFADFVISENALVQIPDIEQIDFARFRHESDMGFRFFMGTPIHVSGFPVGALIVLHEHPRDMPRPLIDMLARIAKLIEGLLAKMQLGQQALKLEQKVIRYQEELEVMSRRRDEKPVVMCPWSKQILHKGKWIDFDQFLHRGLGIRVSHGMSDEALARLESGESI